MRELNGVLIRCPECRSTISNGSGFLKCNDCDWQKETVQGVYNLLPLQLDSEKINENSIHEKVKDPVWRDIVFKKKLYFEKFEKYWMKEVITGETKTFLELGGGLCYCSALAKYHNPGLITWATDVSQLYLSSKSSKVARLMEVDVDCYAAVDAENLPFQDGQFDAVFISHSIHHIGNIVKMLQDAWRALRPGGRFLGVDIAAPSIKRRFEKDIRERSERGVEFGIHEKSLRFKDWSALIEESGVPGVKLRYEPGPKTKSQFLRSMQNRTRRIPVWISMHKPVDV